MKITEILQKTQIVIVIGKSHVTQMISQIKITTIK